VVEVTVELIAHRAGNHPGGAAAAAGADLVELDVHLCGDRLEVRHEKRVWGTRRLWERWYLLPRDTPRWTLAEALADAGDGAPVLLDLKGVSPRLAHAVRREIGDRRAVTVSTKSWWLLPHLRADGVRTFRSAGNRLELALLLRMPSRVRPDGVVVHQRQLDDAVVRRLRQRAALVWSWGATDRAGVDRLAAAGVDGVILDSVELIRELRIGRSPCEG
jgi:glycerophosphoryl diester phosphodiesterase